MKTTPFRFVFAAATLLTASSAFAATATWNGSTSTDWNVGGNWTGGTGTGGIAGAADVATFTGAVTSNLPDMASAPQSVLGLNFGTATGGWTLTGTGQTLTIGTNGIDASAQTSGTTNINVTTVTLGADQTWKIGTGGTLAVGSNILLADSTTRNLILEGNVSHSGTLGTGKASILNFKTTTPGTTTATWTQTGAITLDPRNSTSSSSTMSVNEGVTFDASNVTSITLKSSGGNSGKAFLSIDKGTFITGKAFNNSATTGTGFASVDLTNGGTIKLSASSTITQLLTVATGTASIRMTVGTGGGVIDTNGASTSIDRVISGVGSLTKSNAGTLTLSGVNTYTGGTVVNGGTLAIGSGGTVIVNATSGINITAGALSVDGTIKLTSSSATIANAGAITLNSSSSVLDIGAYFNGQANGSSYQLMTGTTSTTGTFSSILFDTNAFSSVTFNNLDGKLSFVSAVPEPSTYGLVGAGALAAAAFVRRRRKHAAA